MFEDLLNAWAISKKDLLLEMRRKSGILSMLIFSLVIILSFSLAIEEANRFNPGTILGEELVPAIFWIDFSFAGMFGLSVVFAREREGRTLDALKIAPIKPQSVFVGKLIFTLILMAIVEVFTVVLTIVVFNFFLPSNILLLILVLLVGTWDYAVAGCIVSALTLSARSSNLIIPILLFPLILPSIALSISLTSGVLAGYFLEDLIVDLVILVAHSAILLSSILLTAEYLFSE